MTRALVVRMTVQQGSAGSEAPRRRATLVRICDACGAAVCVGVAAEAVPARWGAVWFCDACTHALPAAEADRQRHEIALRGVPLS
jgi:hypothetical protein